MASVSVESYQVKPYRQREDEEKVKEGPDSKEMAR